MKKLLLAVPLGLLLPLLAAAPASADDRRCAGTIRAQLVDGDVIVPRGATCRLVGTRVDGNVKVRRGATLVVRGAKVDGNIQADNHRRVVVRPRKVDDQLRFTRVGGSIQLKQGGGGLVLKARVNGDVQLFSNDGRFTVRRNVIGGNLQCKSNSPRPIGGGNRVEGDKEDQCRGL